VVTDDIRANTNLRVALRLHDRSDARDVVGVDAPALFAPGLPGRAVLRLGPDELVVFQTAISSCRRPSPRQRLRIERVDASHADQRMPRMSRACSSISPMPSATLRSCSASRAHTARGLMHYLPCCIRAISPTQRTPSA